MNGSADLMSHARRNAHAFCIGQVTKNREMVPGRQTRKTDKLIPPVAGDEGESLMG